MDEILRLIDALQAADTHGIAAPADWKTAATNHLQHNEKPRNG
jgi:alkyl hydroperoxide reductase subunit AhpC